MEYYHLTQHKQHGYQAEIAKTNLSLLITDEIKIFDLVRTICKVEKIDKAIAIEQNFDAWLIFDAWHHLITFHHCSDAWHHCSDAWHHCSDVNGWFTPKSAYYYADDGIAVAKTYFTKPVMHQCSDAWHQCNVTYFNRHCYDNGDTGQKKFFQFKIILPSPTIFATIIYRESNQRAKNN